MTTYTDTNNNTERNTLLNMQESIDEQHGYRDHEAGLGEEMEVSCTNRLTE
jgi:hypothetical protein